MLGNPRQAFEEHMWAASQAYVTYAPPPWYNCLVCWVVDGRQVLTTRVARVDVHNQVVRQAAERTWADEILAEYYEIIVWDPYYQNSFHDLWRVLSGFPQDPGIELEVHVDGGPGHIFTCYRGRMHRGHNAHSTGFSFLTRYR